MQVSFLTAFLAGIFSFLSPCVLPLVPGYLSFISGVSLEEMSREQGKAFRYKVFKKVTFNSVLFIFGFSLVFILLGASATYIGGFLRTKVLLLNRVAGIIIIIFGLHTAGVFKIRFLQYEKRFHAQQKPLPWVGSILVGMAFAFGWSPCIGPILAGILVYASTQETVGKGIVLLASYSLGLGIPFFIAGIAVNSFLSVFKWMKKYLRTIEIIAGIFLVLLGILIFMNKFGILISKFSFLQKFSM